MVSSPGFGSSAGDKRLLRLAFAWAPGITPLTKPPTAYSLSRSTKVRRHPDKSRLRLIFWQEISGSISLPSRGSFHLSLTVLVHYRSLDLFSLGWWSTQIQAGLHVSDPTQEHPTEYSDCAYGALTRYGVRSRSHSASWNIQMLSPQPPDKSGFGLFPFRSPLLRESLLISFPQLHEMFQFCVSYNRTILFIRSYPAKAGWVPHSEILGSMRAYPLTEAYRRFQRPSSESRIEASISCQYFSFYENLLLINNFYLLKKLSLSGKL